MTAMPDRNDGIVSKLPASSEMGLAPAIRVEPIADVCPSTDGFEFFVESFSADFPLPITFVASDCGCTDIGEPFLSALCNVLAKLLVLCPQDCRGRACRFCVPDDEASGWIKLASTGSVSRLFCKHSFQCMSNTKGGASRFQCRLS